MPPFKDAFCAPAQCNEASVRVGVTFRKDSIINNKFDPKVVRSHATPHSNPMNEHRDIKTVDDKMFAFFVRQETPVLLS